MCPEVESPDTSYDEGLESCEIDDLLNQDIQVVGVADDTVSVFVTGTGKRTYIVHPGSCRRLSGNSVFEIVRTIAVTFSCPSF